MQAKLDDLRREVAILEMIPPAWYELMNKRKAGYLSIPPAEIICIIYACVLDAKSVAQLMLTCGYMYNRGLNYQRYVYQQWCQEQHPSMEPSLDGHTTCAERYRLAMGYKPGKLTPNTYFRGYLEKETPNHKKIYREGPCSRWDSWTKPDLCGYGIRHDSHGASEKGDFNNGRLHTKNGVQSTQGALHVGQFFMGLPSGIGIRILSDTNICIIGTFHKGDITFICGWKFNKNKMTITYGRFNMMGGRMHNMDGEMGERWDYLFKKTRNVSSEDIATIMACFQRPFWDDIVECVHNRALRLRNDGAFQPGGVRGERLDFDMSWPE